MVPGPAYSRREEMESDCSLSIRGLVGADSGIYTLLIREPQIRTAKINLVVYELLAMPEVTPDAVLVAEEDNVTLQCHPPPGTVTTWWQRGDAPLSPGGRLSLSPDNLTLTVTAARRGDAGLYGCHVANPVSNNRSRDVNVTVACEWADVAPLWSCGTA
ncbi:carcinoembryonic antigen-related cell adhesion molecule 21-like [Phasianus colchicus]|uniref:Ig-like domain-containing protein n=1 Tax=Phasianus colchicus TaxID=9054 RepID=A0A669QQ64_PHACC|nr:carcinoembryonic antigen-related cell adhesion molecule 21-like [Phasianus colchicus]